MKRHLMLSLVALAALALTAPAQAAFPAQNGKIAFTSNRDGNFDVYVMDADGENQTNVTNQDGNRNIHPVWSPDGTKIAFTSDRDDHFRGDVYVMDADGQNQTRLTTPGVVDMDPAFSPDGTKIAFTSDRDGDLDVYVMDADGQNQTPLTHNAVGDSEPAFSPDGTKIAFTRHGDSLVDDEVYVMDADGQNQTPLTTNAWLDRGPAFSPDGTKIAFSSNRAGDSGIYVMDADGQNQTNLTNGAGVDESPAFSPDGTKIAFERDWVIYVMDADGQNLTPLTSSTGLDRDPDWGPFVAPPDADGDGIPDDEDVESIQEAITGLPASAFKGGHPGHSRAMTVILDKAEALIASGDLSGARRKLENLRGKVDGCGSMADTTDWIVDCPAQLDVRALIDALISNLSS